MFDARLLTLALVCLCSDLRSHHHTLTPVARLHGASSLLGKRADYVTLEVVIAFFPKKKKKHFDGVLGDAPVTRRDRAPSADQLYVHVY